MAPETTDLAGGAASSAITGYRPNGPDSPAPRTPDALLAWAAEHGVTVPDWAEVRVAGEGYEPEVRRRPVPAAYFRALASSPRQWVYWSAPPGGVGGPISVVDPQAGRVLIVFRRSVLSSDEQFLHVLAHEVFEASRLREEFHAVLGKRLTAAAVDELTRAERGLNNLHAEAWDHADALLRRFRGPDIESPPP